MAIQIAIDSPPRVQRIDFTAWGRKSSAGHDHAVGILLCSGAAEFSLDRRIKLRPGELYVIPRAAPHAFHGVLEAGTHGWGINLGDGFDRVPARTVTQLDESRSVELDLWLQRMDAEQRSDDACSIAMREAIFRAIYIQCARLTGVASCGDHPRLVSNALQIISNEYQTALRPRDIAERVGVTPAHLSHELRRRTGRSPSEWIAQARVDAAKLRLLSSRDSVSTIAAAVGYTDVSQLNRQFRQIAGVSPHAWRNANKASHPTN